MDCPDTLDNILRFMMIEAKCSHEIHDLRSLTFEHLILVDGKRWYCLASNHSFLRSECVDDLPFWRKSEPHARWRITTGLIHVKDLNETAILEVFTDSTFVQRWDRFKILLGHLKVDGLTWVTFD